VPVALGVSCLVALAMCAVPLLGIHGIESALLLGVVQPPLCAYACASLTRRYLAETPVPRSLTALFNRTIGFAGALWLVPVLVLWLDSLRIRNCNPLEGFASMLLGPLFGIALASLVGTGLGLRWPRVRGLPLLAAGVPIATELHAIYGLYNGPSIYAYGHFFGFFPGTLYDEGVTFTHSFLWLRVATAVWVIACSLAIVSCAEPATLALRLRPLRDRAGRRLLQLLTLTCLAAGLYAESQSDTLGWTSSTARVRNALGGALTSRRCHIYFPREWAERDRKRLAQDCDFRVHQAEAWLQLEHPRPIDVYLFRSPAEKYALMGAEGTNLAKPWRSEVYISSAGWPNPVLGHELVHAVAQGTGRGPFAIAGRWGGLWPNPALIEGVAMAAAFQPSGGLTLHEWAHAMLELGMVPPLSQLFGPGFLGQQERLAYTLSGSLLRFVHERWGAAAVRATYRSGDLAQGVGVPLSEIDAAWRAALRAQPLAASARDLARVRFSGSGVLSALCPRVLAKLRDGLRTDISAGDDAKARLSCGQILTIDPQDAATRATLASLYTRQGDDAAANLELERLLREHAPAPYRLSVRQAIADQALRVGRYPAALAQYETLLAEPNDDDQKRALQVKALACRAATSGGATGVRQARILHELLVGDAGQRTDPATAVHLARELSDLRADGLGAYLEGRQLFFQARFRYAAELFMQARQRGLPTSELELETVRIEAISRLAEGEQLEAAAELFQTWKSRGSLAQRAEADDYLARIAYLSQQRP